MACSGRTYLVSVTLATASLLFLLGWGLYSPGQDHLISISLDGDGSWFENYERGSEIQDHDIFFHNIGRSIDNARKADVIFLGTSVVLFALDRMQFEKFEADHRIRMFNMAFAGVTSGEFSRRVIEKWDLHPKLLIIDLLPTGGNAKFKFFYESLDTSPQFGDSMVERVVGSSWITGYEHVIGRNLRWRVEKAVSRPRVNTFRSAANGNWHVDGWPNRTSADNPKLAPVRDDCAASADEIGVAKDYIAAIGARVVLTQTPTANSCPRRVRELSAALGAPYFVVDPTRFSTVDGGHLDEASAKAYSTELLHWLEHLPDFQQIVTAASP